MIAEQKGKTKGLVSGVLGRLEGAAFSQNEVRPKAFSPQVRELI